MPEDYRSVPILVPGNGGSPPAPTPSYGPFLTWLHLSDLHCCKAKTGWDAARVLEALREDLEKLRDEGLSPDLVLFTGDAAFGELPGSPIADQFDEARRFFDGILKICGLSPERLFLVPGNHDVNRKKISKRLKVTPSDVLDMLRDADEDWAFSMRRLKDYRAFLRDAGYTHLLDDPDRLIYTRRLEIDGIDVGIAGLNSSWWCSSDEDKGRLWLGGEWQLATVEEEIRDADVKIGLIHHPLGWFTTAEDEPMLQTRFERIFDFHLHGHEHLQWVYPLASGAARIAAGACYARERGERSGYNVVRLDVGTGHADVWLRQYQERSQQWAPISTQGTIDSRGVWTLNGLRCGRTTTPSTQSPPPPAPDDPAVIAAIRERAAVAAWRAHVETSNSRLTPVFHHADDPGAVPELLEHIYVKLHLRGRALMGELGMRRDFSKPRTLEQILHLPTSADDLLTGRWLLFGDPGAGKTTLLRHLAHELARRADAPWLPIFLSLPRLLDERGDDPLDIAVAELASPDVERETLRRAFERRGEDGHLLLLFDGFDEVPSGKVGRAKRILAAVAKRWPRSPVVVSSRPIGGRRIDGFVELEVLPFERRDRLEFLSRWLGKPGEPARERAESALVKLESVGTLWELAGNPLYLTLLAMLIEEGEDLPDRRAQLYERIFDFLYEGKYRRGDGEPCKRIKPRPVVEDCLRHLAWSLTEANRDAEPAKTLQRRLWKNPATREALATTRWKDDPQAFLDEVAASTSILAEHDGPRRGWRFWHRTFREALAAEALVEMLREEGEEALLRHAGEDVKEKEGQWGEPYALLVGHLDGSDSELPEPDALVERLMETNRTLGLRALSTAQGLRAETLERILVELGKETERYGALKEELKPYSIPEAAWMARAEVYRRIPELLGDADAALELLDSLRRRTSDGNDLFFLDLAMAEVAERWPDRRRDAERRRERIFADFIPPAGFDEVAVPVDELWCEISAGRFTMGYADSEGDYDEKTNPLGGRSWERPQHEVVIASNFHIASIPVTNAQYRVFDPSHTPHAFDGVDAAELDDHPVVNVTWYAAVMFCRWLAEHHSGIRLATEEEWEYACRAGTTTRFWSGDSEDDLKRVGWHGEGPNGRTHKVGEKPANPWGLYDVHGNVWEWTKSVGVKDYSEYESGRQADPSAERAVCPADLAGDAAATPGGRRVFRGGSYWDSADWTRSAYRGRVLPWDRSQNLGFRLVCVLPRPELEH